jgi:hypothetical protein
MNRNYTFIPIDKRDEVIVRLRSVCDRLDIDKDFSTCLSLETAIQVLSIWTDWDEECTRLIAEAEEERRQVSPEVSDISVASV